VRRRHDLFAAIAPEQRYEVQALLRAGAGRRASAFLSSAMLRRSASMRLMARRGTAQLCFGCGGMPACLALSAPSDGGGSHQSRMP
jgi:hypothetical protein